MRVLLDNCVPRRLRNFLTGCETLSVVDLGRADLEDRKLLDIMAGQFDALITMDKGIRFQQQLGHRPFGVILLRAGSSRLSDLLPLTPALLQALEKVEPGELLEVSA
jgi:predicted nuclease of predicted toxin-antitoxin system